MTGGHASSTRHRWTWPQVVFCLIIVGILVAAAVPTFYSVSPQLNQSRTASNCRQIVIALMLYARDHEGKYPDEYPTKPTTANQAFRILIREDYLADERCFGAALSPFKPDGIIGDKPDFPKALEHEENHWAMTKELTKKIPPPTLLVFENPMTTSWPPTWSVAAAGQKKRGRTWRGGKIIVGSNAGSIQTIDAPVTSDSLSARTFFRSDRPMEILDIEE